MRNAPANDNKMTPFLQNKQYDNVAEFFND